MRTLFVIVALVFTLGIGIALGTGPLGDKIEEQRPVPTTQASGSATAGSDPLDSALATKVAPGVLAGKLAGQRIALVTLPGVQAATTKALGADIVAAGGAVASTTAVTTALTGTGEKAMVDSLGAQLLGQIPNLVDGALSTYPRIGAILGKAITVPGAGATAATLTPTAQTTTLRETFLTAKLVSAPINGHLATLTLVVAADEVDAAIVTGLVSGLRSQTRGLVVAGPTRSVDVASLRSAGAPGTAAATAAVGTFDGVETDAGRIGAVLLLARQITSPGGSFGASGSDGTLPLG